MRSAETDRDRFAVQAAFAAWLRDPRGRAMPADIPPERLSYYREQFAGHLRDLLGAAFPVLRRLHGDTRWAALLDAFLAAPRGQTAMLHRLAGEFVDWLADVRAPAPGDLPFLVPLAHFEWATLALSVADAPPAAALLANPHGDLLDGVPVVSPLVWTLAYDWPVQRIAADPPTPTPAQMPAPVPTFLILHRAPQGPVACLDVNAITARLLTLAEANPELCGAALLAGIAEELDREDVDEVIAAGAEILDSLRERGIILGTRRRPA